MFSMFTFVFCSPAAPPLGATKEKNIEPVLNLPMSYHAICSIISQNPHYYSFRTPRERDKVMPKCTPERDMYRDMSLIRK